jgi:hypothetical protein
MSLLDGAERLLGEAQMPKVECHSPLEMPHVLGEREGLFVDSTSCVEVAAK